MAELPTHSPEIIWRWNVCEEYQNAEYLSGVVKGVKSLNAYDVIQLDIRPVDRVWVLLHDAFLPDAVLSRAMERIKLGASRLKNPHARSQVVHETGRREKKGDYFRSAACVASAVVKNNDPKKLAVDANYDREYQRQLAIIREELDKWSSEQGLR